MARFFSFIIVVLTLTSCGSGGEDLPAKVEDLPAKVLGKYIDEGFDGPQSNDSYIELKKDNSWVWTNNSGENLAKGTYTSTYEEDWVNGPESWSIEFNIESGSLRHYFDESRMIYYHDLNKATGERNYYRLNGVQPSTSATTNLFKR